MADRLRRIVIDGVPYRWRFDDVLVVIPGDRSGPPLYVDWGWQEWVDGPGPDPQFVTPRFVAQAIRFALALGWASTTPGRPMRLGFQGDRFFMAK
jgi:hypothetical protein